MEDLLKQAYGLFADLIGNGMSILPPDKNFLFYEQYDFSHLSKHREEGTLLIGEYQKGTTKENPAVSGYGCANGLKFTIDFGDSAHKTGHLAFCNSEVDKNNLSQFEKQDKLGFMVRHPSQPPWNNWKNCTRDQLLAYAAGCWRAGKEDIVKRLLDEHNKRTNIVGFPLCQNSERDCLGTFKGEGKSDILAPHHVMFLRICSGDTEAYKDPIAQLALQMDIEVTEKNYKTEKLQLILMAIVCGRLDLYVHVHDNYKENIMHYWNNTSKDGDSEREQAQIGDAFIKVIECELKRYSGQLQPSTLGLPVETLKTLLSSEYFQIFFLGNVTLLSEFINRFIAALSTDAQKIAKEIENYIKNAFKNPLNILNVPFMPYNPIAKLLNNLFNGTDLSEVYSRLNEIQKGIIELNNLSNEILKAIKSIPEETKKLLYTGEIDITIKDFKNYSNTYALIAEKQGVQKAIEVVSKDLDPLILKFSSDSHKYFVFEKKYLSLPYVVNVMDMHMSCITLAKAKDSPAYLINMIIDYKDWIKNVVDDRLPGSLFKMIEDAQNELRTNVLYIKSLYNLTFTATGEYFMNDINKKHDPMEPVSYGISGVAKHYDYIMHETIDLEKNQNLQQVIDKGIINIDCLPKIVEKKLLSEEPFNLDGTYGKKPPEFITKITSEQAELTQKFDAHDIWYICDKILDKESEPHPKFNNADYNAACEKLKTLGENIVNLSMLMYIGQTALERIDQITKTANDLLDK